uniref:Uncharacterized protein n=1 Tax=Timema bartmani TaxID=61472 RepID=A0A7R9HVZ8_9NEOP|nr:unnamed protein product [Timema bartmani]
MNKHSRRWMYNRKRLQAIAPGVCSRYCNLFAVAKAIGWSLRIFTHMFSTTDLCKNDRLAITLFYQLQLLGMNCSLSRHHPVRVKKNANALARLVRFHSAEKLYKFCPITEDDDDNDTNFNCDDCRLQIISPDADICVEERSYEKVKQHRDWFIEEEKLRVDESKRLGKAKSAGDVFGLEGSFKKLDID